MKYLLTLLTLLVAPQVAPDAPGPVTIDIVVIGDTLSYRVGWGPGARASSYLFTTAVTATNGSWVVVADSNISGKWITGPGIGPLPATGEITTTSFKTWLTAVPWDSATFSVTVASKNAAGLSATSVGSKRIVRLPGPPGPVTIDSSLVVTETLVLPNATMGLGASRIECAFKQFANGAVAEWTADRPSCDSIYIAYVPAPQRIVSAAQQAHTDSLATTCVTQWTGPSTVAIVPLAPCSSAALVTALAP